MVLNFWQYQLPPMSNSSEVLRLRPHIALLPSAGMGHLTPLLRLAASLVNHNCQLTLITTHPTVSLAETRLISQFLSSFPYITTNEFHLLPLNEQSIANEDPFFLQFEAISRSAHLLSPLLSTASPPLSALITDISLASAVTPITADLHLPNFVLFTSSASMLSLCAHFPFISTTTQDSILIPGLPQPLPKSMLPPPLQDRSSLFAAQFTANGRELVKSNGIIINTLDAIEGNTLKALNEGEVVKGLPPVIPIGPLIPCDQFERSRVILNVAPPTPMASWLDEQEEGSVVYVNFGSRTAMSREQIQELGEGLVKSGHKFLWVVKGKKVDRENEEAVGEVVGGRQGIEEAVAEGRGVVVKEWVAQNWVLGHRAVGGFVSHCGWNSVMEAAWNGVRVLAWPQGGDQKVNAAVVEGCGLGVWKREWGWGVVGGEEIGRKIREMMEDEELKVSAGMVREEAKRAVGDDGGSSKRSLEILVEIWSNGCGSASSKFAYTGA